MKWAKQQPEYIAGIVHANRFADGGLMEGTAQPTVKTAVLILHLPLLDYADSAPIDLNYR